MSRRIEIGTIIAAIGLILVLAGKLMAQGAHEADQDKAIDAINKEHDRWAPKVDKVDVIENDIKHIIATITETRNDVKRLLEERNR